ncbi:UNVERIFIED_CONTAM: hypothetical protein GTU68_001242 [Idotea baltica]|nr:hypothetical protein [Idotea baltica]
MGITENISTLSEQWLPVVAGYAAHLVFALLTLAIGWWLIGVVTRKIKQRMINRSADPVLINFVSSCSSIGLKVVLFICVATMVGIETTSFVAILGAAGLAIGLSLQGSLSNFAGGVLFLVFRPFKEGDWIEAQGVSGTVNALQIFHTILKTADNKLVIVPNGVLSNGTITNYTNEPTRRVDINVGIDYASDIKKARKVLLSIASDPRIITTDDMMPAVFVTGLGDSAVDLSLRVWVKTEDFWQVTFDFTEQAKERLIQEGIEIPFPQRVVHLSQPSA